MSAQPQLAFLSVLVVAAPAEAADRTVTKRFTLKANPSVAGAASRTLTAQLR